MELYLDQINWPAILVCVVVGQILLTVWFLVLFGNPWARAYGGAEMTKAEHTKAIPGYTYGIGAACVFLLSIGVSILQSAFQVHDVSGALLLALVIAVTIFIPMAMPAYAFLKRWSAWWIGAGSQIVLVAAISLIQALWPAAG